MKTIIGNMLVVLGRTATASGRSCRAGTARLAAVAASPIRVMQLDRKEHERWSGGFGTAGRPSIRGWLWTAAAVTAMTTATATSTPASSTKGEARGKTLSAAARCEEKPLWRPRSSDAQARHGACVGAGTRRGSRSSGEGHPILLKERSNDLEGGGSALRGEGRIESGAAVGKREEEDPWAGKAVLWAGRPLFTSINSAQGHRPYMEDEFFLSSDGSFAAVYDGHGGANVSKYLRQNLYRHIQLFPLSYTSNALDQFMENLPSEGKDAYDLAAVKQALKLAYEISDNYVTTQTSYCNEGSCAVSVTVHCDRQGKASIISGNVGDSRAVLSRGGGAIDLTEDHKPNNPHELERIYRHDGIVTWEGFESLQGLQIEETGVYRVNGNLAVARTIGDFHLRPWVSGEAEIRTIEINREADQFVILASDGLWDVMSSEEAVQYVHSIMARAIQAGSGDGSGETPLVNLAQNYAEDHGIIRAVATLRKKKMASYLTDEAMRRGSMDNTTVAIVWLQ